MVSDDELEEGKERAEQARVARIAEAAAKHDHDVQIGSKQLLVITEWQLQMLSPALDALRTCYRKAKTGSKTVHGRLVFTAANRSWNDARKPSLVTSLREDTIPPNLEKCCSDSILRLGLEPRGWIPLSFIDED